MKSVSKGFSLLELLVGMVIITIALSAAIPPYLRNMRQQKVDFYTQQLETGFFGLRAKLGQQKTSCTLKFDTSGLSNFVAPADLVEMQENPERLECCNSDLEAAGEPNGCAYGPKIGTILAELPINLSRDERNKIIRNRSLRLLDREKTPESKEVEISVSLSSYDLTPPGTSTSSEEIIFLIRSTNSQETRLRTRCIVISGTGNIFRASWNPETNSCEKQKISH